MCVYSRECVSVQWIDLILNDGRFTPSWPRFRINGMILMKEEKKKQQRRMEERMNVCVCAYSIFFCLLWHERTANKIRNIGKTKANNKCVQFVTNRFWPKKSSEVSQRQCRCAQMEFRIQIIIEEYSIHAKYVPNCMNTNSENGTRCTSNNHTHTNTRKNPSKRMKQIDSFRMLRVKIESFYHLTICNSIHFSSFTLRISRLCNFGWWADCSCKEFICGNGCTFVKRDD